MTEHVLVEIHFGTGPVRYGSVWIVTGADIYSGKVIEFCCDGPDLVLLFSCIESDSPDDRALVMVPERAVAARRLGWPLLLPS